WVSVRAAIGVFESEGGENMPEDEVIERAERDKRQGKSASTQAGEFVREEMEHIREGKHGARSPQQAIAIGLSKARRAGVKLAAPKRGAVSARSRRNAERELAEGRGSRRSRKPSRRRSRAVSKALRREGHRAAASGRALSRQARASARRRTASQRSAAAKRAAQTKGPRGRSAAARKGARTRARNRSR